MRVRVISGSMRGKKLISPPDERVRPTLDRVKENIFNMIAFNVPGALVLDLFSGSGALGIEALSRGAESAVFVDKSDESLFVTKENLKLTSFSDKAECVNLGFDDYLKSCNKNNCFQGKTESLGWGPENCICTHNRKFFLFPQQFQQLSLLNKDL